MIKLEVADYCHNCPHFYPETDRHDFGVCCETTVFCVNTLKCKNIFDYFMKTYEVSLKPVKIEEK